MKPVSQPEILVGTLINYKKKPLKSGEEIEHKVTILNPPDVDAQSAMFILDSLVPETELVAGSVVTSQGSITTGNGVDDTTILIEIGDITDGQVVEIYFLAVATLKGPSTFAIQGSVSANNVASFLTDDPADASGSADPTLAMFAETGGFFVIPIPGSPNKVVVIPE